MAQQGSGIGTYLSKALNLTLQVFFAPPKPDEGDGELIDWVEEEEEGGYMTPPTDAQLPAGTLLQAQPLSCIAPTALRYFYRSHLPAFFRPSASHSTSTTC